MGEYTDRSLPPVGSPVQVKTPGGQLITVRAGETRIGTRLGAQPRIISALERHPLPVTSPPATASSFDNPIVGGRFTLFLLMYGDYVEMHRIVLTSLMETTTPDRVEIRIGSNQLCDPSKALVEHFVRTGRVSVHYCHPDNQKKYPVMREMFHDPARPITTPYVIWLDDDTVTNVNPDWLELLADKIVQEHPKGARLFGPHYRWVVSPAQMAWIRQAEWYDGRPLQDDAGREVPNGNRVHFATGSFWALATEMIQKQGIPDLRLGHNGGDWIVGLMVRCGGGKLAGFSNKKNVVNWSAFERRGYRENPLGLQ